MKSELLAEYNPYHYMPEFQEGWDDYMAGHIGGKYQDVKGQAYDRGQEAAMRWQRRRP